jgi:NAD(P)-dependent dehydrogenase (short-subunit alcohol dehydrogenase family)
MAGHLVRNPTPEATMTSTPITTASTASTTSAAPTAATATTTAYQPANPLDFRDQGVLITGGSRGLGATMAHELAARGARVALVARGAGELEAVAAAIRAAGGTAHAIVADVGDKAAIHPIAGAAAALLGRVDVLVHDASTLGPVPLRLLADTACEDLQRVLEVNLIGPFRLTKAVLGPMVLRGHGQVVHISSDAAVAAYPRWGAYGVSKAALDHLNRSWASELDGTGVRFLAVDPGDMDTDMHAAAVPDADRAALQRPADVARALADLLADDRVANGARVTLAQWRAELARAERSPAEPSPAEPSPAEPSPAEPSPAEPSRAERWRAER